MALMGLRPPFPCIHPLDPDGRSFSSKKPHHPRFYSPPEPVLAGPVSISQPKVSAFRDSIPDPLGISSPVVERPGYRPSIDSRLPTLRFPLGRRLLFSHGTFQTILIESFRGNRDGIGAERGPTSFVRCSSTPSESEGETSCFVKRDSNLTTPPRRIYESAGVVE